MYSEITMESRTHLKTVKNTFNIFAVYRNTEIKKETENTICYTSRGFMIVAIFQYRNKS